MSTLTKTSTSTEGYSALDLIQSTIHQSTITDVDSIEPAATDTTASLSAYVPASKGFSLEVSTPTSMAYETATALQNLQNQYGDIDEWVMRQLKYESKKALFKALSAEQIDVVALAINNILKGEGVVVGDQTGIGKGRVAAAVIRFAVKNNFPAIFVTEKSTLFSDFYRDLRDIGSDEFVPFIINTHTTKNQSDIRMVDEDGRSQYYYDLMGNDFYRAPKSAKEMARRANELMKDIGENAPISLGDDYDFMMLTYTQVSGDYIAAKRKALQNKRKLPKEKGNQEKTVLIRRYMKGAVVVLDESHNAGGGDSTTGYFFRETLATALGACYLSATFAKRADNMPLYGIKTAISDTGLSDSDLQKVFEAGGLPLQEIAAAELVRAGQMVRRQRTFDGIKVIWKKLEPTKELINTNRKENDRLAAIKADHTAKADSVTEIMRNIQNFQSRYVNQQIEAIDKNLFGSSAEERKGLKNAGVDNAGYFNKSHLVISQLLFALKAKEVAEETIELLNENKKVIIAISNTMGSFLTRLGYENGDEMGRVDFSTVLLEGLDSVLAYTVKEEDGTTEKQFIEIEDLSIEAQDAYEEIVERINQISQDLTASPIDVLINVIQSTERPTNIGGQAADYYRVRECTGRNAQIVFENGVPIYRKFNADKGKFFAEFNGGSADVLIINQSASTGVSAHSSEKFADQRQRCMIIHQPELNINTEVQKRGRINRTGQVNLPEYYYIQSSIPAEQRQFMVLKAKLKSLDANTTGNQQNSKDQLDTLDFMNKYGGRVIFKYLEDNPALNALMGRPCFRTTKDRSGEEWEDRISFGDIPKRVTNRIQLVSVAQQETFYNSIVKAYLELVAEEKERGTYDLELEFLDYQAEVKSRFLWVEGKTGATTSFGKSAVLDDSKVKVLTKPYKMSRIHETLEKNLNGQSPNVYMEYYLDKIQADYPNIIKGKQARSQGKLDRLKNELSDLEVSLKQIDFAGKNEEEIEQLEKEVKKLQSKIETAKRRVHTQMETIEKSNATYQADFINLKNILSSLRPGTVVKVDIFTEATPTPDESPWGIVLGFQADLTAENPWIPSNLKYKIALLSKKFSVLTQKLSDSKIYKIVQDASAMTDEQRSHVIKHWDNSTTRENFEKIYIATGNIFKALNRASNHNGKKLIKYTTKSGAIKNGLYLPETQSTTVDFRAEQSLESLKEYVKNMPVSDELKLKNGFIIIRRESPTRYRLDVRGNRAIITDPDILRRVVLTPEDHALGRTKGQFRSNAAYQYGFFDGSDIFEVMDNMTNLHGVTVQNEVIELGVEDVEPVSLGAMTVEKELEVLLGMLRVEVG